LLAIAGALLVLLLPSRLRDYRRRKLLGVPVPGTWAAILQRRMPIYSTMPADLRDQLHRHMNVLLSEKRFIGCGGLDMTEEIRVTVAGHAALLLLNRPVAYFPGFSSILVYPDTYMAQEISYDGEVEVLEEVARAGESWHRGPVVLSWQDILDGISGDAGGMNVILHEFAHKLDEEDGATEGLPLLTDDAHYEEWAEVLGREFATLGAAFESGQDSLLDDYALTSPAEFFAVATEAYFEQATAMRQQLPDLYRQLQKYYRVDPASWATESAAE
jgi:hypothetical protein